MTDYPPLPPFATRWRPPRITKENEGLGRLFPPTQCYCGAKLEASYADHPLYSQGLKKYIVIALTCPNIGDNFRWMSAHHLNVWVETHHAERYGLEDQTW